MRQSWTERWPLIALVLAALLSIVLLQWNHQQSHATLQEQTAALEHLMQARLNVDRSYMIVEQISADDRRLPQDTSVYLDRALWAIDDWQAERNRLAPSGEAELQRLLAQYRAALATVHDLELRAPRDPRSPDGAAERRSDFLALEQHADALEHALRQLLESTIIRQQQQHVISLALWCAFLGLFGAAIFQLLRARRATTSVLASSEERFRAQYKGIPIPTYTWQKAGDDFILRSFNDAAEHITAGAVAKLVGARASKLYHDRPDFLADFARCAAEHVTIQRELEYYFQSSQESKILFTSYVFIPPDLIMVHTEDLSERKRLESQLLRAQKMEGIGRLAGGIAHDFNNLLTAILGYADLALDSLPHNQPVRADLVEIQKAAERAAKLTAQLLAFARKQPLQPSNLQLNELIGNMEGLIRRVLPEHILVRTWPATQLGTVRADAGQVEQVLLNLVLNARDAMPDGGEISIETSNIELDEAYALQYAEVAPGPYVLLAVSDTGVGMPPDVQLRAFEPFFTTKGPSQGSGLGLAMCYGIVKQHSGHITIYSEVGQGTTINVYLPQIDALSIAYAEEPGARIAHGTETVLVAEDQDQVRAVVVLMLRQLGYTVLEASSGAEALRIAEQHGSGAIQLVITDVVMPYMSGRELSEKLSAWDAAIKVLYISGYSENVIAHHQQVEQGVALLTKPFSTASLAEKIRLLLD